MGRYVIVTGLSRGIGKSVAERLKADGFTVVTHSVASGGTDLQFDIADREAAKAALENWIAAHGAPYGVVLNAGIADDAPFPGMEDGQWDRVLSTPAARRSSPSRRSPSSIRSSRPRERTMSPS